MIKGIHTIDFHAHILPGADHGSSGPKMTLEQLALMNNVGVDTVVATPHFYPNYHTVDGFLERVEDAVSLLPKDDAPRPRICLGAEVLYYGGMEEMEDLDKLCIRGTDILLLELPISVWDMELFDTVARLAKKKTVVLAHIDRYLPKQEDEIDALLESGAIAQINASSLFHFSTKGKIMRYVNEGLVCAIGSDLHEVDKKAYHHFADAHKKLGDSFERIMEVSAALLKNAERI